MVTPCKHLIWQTFSWGRSGDADFIRALQRIVA